jgi:DNA adenine methylase
MIKSPLRYPYGKSRAIDRIAKLIPDFDEFRESFLGDGSVFIYLQQRYPDKKFWINDLYTDLYKLWIMTQKDVDALTRKTVEFVFRNKIELRKFIVINLASDQS